MSPAWFASTPTFSLMSHKYEESRNYDLFWTVWIRRYNVLNFCSLLRPFLRVMIDLKLRRAFMMWVWEGGESQLDITLLWMSGTSTRDDRALLSFVIGSLVLFSG